LPMGNGLDRKLGREVGGRIYDLATNAALLPHSVAYGKTKEGEQSLHGRTKAGEQRQPLSMFEIEFDRKMEELVKDGWEHANWVYSAPEVAEGIRMRKDGEEYILYFLSSKDGHKDIRTVPSKRNPCANRCGKEGRKKCSTCRTAVYCSAECQLVHWKEHKLSCVHRNV
jgi:hypothetical protein